MQTSTLTHTVVGVFENNATAQRAVDSLTAAGYSRDQLEVTGSDSYTNETETATGGGGISGFFRRLFGDDLDESERGVYSDSLGRGGTVVCVSTTADDQNRAADILNDSGAIDIDKKSESPVDRRYNAESSTLRDNTKVSDRPAERSIPVVEEQLNVGKRTVKRGGVRIYNQVHEEPVERTVNLREERVRVERRPADRPATEADFRNRDEVIEVMEQSEEPVVEKRTRVVEEVVVGKEVTNRTETVRDKLRRGDVSVETLGSEGKDYDSDFRAHYNQRFASNPSASYETYAPAYAYGYRLAGDPRYQGRDWDEIEPTIRTDYERSYPDSKWEQFKDAVRHGWNKMTGRG